MLDISLKELYEKIRIDDAQCDVRFDFPTHGHIAFVWFKDDRRYGRAFSRSQLEAMRFPMDALEYAREQAERELNQCER